MPHSGEWNGQEVLIPKYICRYEKLPERFQDNFIIPIDQEIWPLVRILNLKDIPTLASCKGDYKRSDRDFVCPWVAIRPSVQGPRLNSLETVMGQYNTQARHPWELEPLTRSDGALVALTLFPQKEAPLVELQASVQVLADYLQQYLPE